MKTENSKPYLNIWNQGQSYVKDRWLFYFALVLFIIAKAPHLNDAFYWDESWVYAPAVYYMYDHGPSLLPASIPVEYSRGHPLFFHAVCAAWMNIFGRSACSMHCFALFTSLLLAVAVYELMMKLFNRRVAMIGVALLLLNADFFISSSFVLTDVMLALFTFLSLYNYVKENYFSTAVFLTLAFYTKESGIMLALVFGIDILWSLITKKYSLAQAFIKSLVIIIPIACIALFFVVQKHTYGWFFYPAHTSIIKLGIDNTLMTLIRSWKVIFYNGGTYWFYLPVFVMCIIVVVKYRQVHYLFIVLSAIVIYLTIFIFSHRDVVFYAFLIFLAWVLWLFISKHLHSFNKLQARFIRLSIMFCFAFTYFSCVNFFEDRYLFPVVLIFSIILLAILYDHLITKISGKLFTYALGLIVVTGIFYCYNNSDGQILYERMEIEQELVSYFEQNIFFEKQVYCDAYLEQVHLKIPYSGFLHTNRTFTHVIDELTPHTELAIFDNIDDSHKDYERVKKDSSFYLLRRFERNKEYIEVYKRK